GSRVGGAHDNCRGDGKHSSDQESRDHGTFLSDEWSREGTCPHLVGRPMHFGSPAVQRNANGKPDPPSTRRLVRDTTCASRDDLPRFPRGKPRRHFAFGPSRQVEPPAAEEMWPNGG